MIVCALTAITDTQRTQPPPAAAGLARLNPSGP